MSFPESPYRGLAQYSEQEAILFAGRTSHIDNCADLLADTTTRVLLLHGHTGCGKSSFLRAGLIPSLELRGFGYLFLRNFDEDTQRGLPLFIRSGPDPVLSLAEELFKYCKHRLVVATALGPQELDLGPALEGATDIEAFVQECRDPEYLLQALVNISAILPHKLVIVLDQVEEVLTLNQSAEGLPRKNRFFRFLKLYNEDSCKAKMILSLRKDHSGEFIGLAQLDNSIRTEFKTYLLPEFSAEEVLSAITLPTSRECLDGERSPHSVYRFEYADGIAQQIVADIFALKDSGPVLPIMQLVCQGLYTKVRSKSEPWVIGKDEYRADTLKECVNTHVTNSLMSSFALGDISQRSHPRELRNWRKALYSLVRHERDGRVSTGLASLDVFTKYVRNPLPVLTYLARNEVMVLRRLTVAGIEVPMFSLGHDIIGLALTQAAVRDTAIEEERKRRTRKIWLAVAATAAAALLAIGAIVRDRINRVTAQESLVATLIASAEEQRRSSPLNALATGIRAVAAAEILPHARDDLHTKATTLLERLASAMPAQTLSIWHGAPTSAPRQDSLLVSPPGFVSAHSTDGLRVRRLVKGGAGNGPVELKSPLLLFDETTYVSTSEPFEDSMLIMFTSPQEPDESKRYKLVIVRREQVFGPYLAGELLNKYAVLKAQRLGQTAEVLSRARLSASISGDLVLLNTQQTNRNRLVRTLRLNKDDMPDPFAAGTELVMRSDDSEPKTRRLLSKKSFVLGRYALTAELDTRITDHNSEMLTNVRWQSLWSDTAKKAAKTSQGKFAVDLQKCTTCSMVLVQNPIRNSLVVFGISGAQAVQAANQLSPEFIGYLVIDAEHGNYKVVPSERIRSARAACSIGSAQNTDFTNTPDFVDGNLNETVFGFKRDNGIFLIRDTKEKTRCDELSHGVGPIRQWRFSISDGMLLGLSEKHFVAWDVRRTDKGPAPGNVSALLKRSCDLGKAIVEARKTEALAKSLPDFAGLDGCTI